MNSLIYSIAAGEEFIESARLMVYSLRTIGRYTGEVVIYSDQDAVIDGATVMRDTVLKVLPHLFMAKAMFGRSMSMAYDKILYLDADIVVINPIQPLLNQESDVSLPEEVVRDIGIYGGDFSLPSHPCRVGFIGWNAGTFMARGTVIQRLCHRWWDLMIENKSWKEACCDQPVINHMMRNEDWRFHPFRREHFFFFTTESDPITRETIIVHPKKHKLATQQAVLNMRALWT